ncbi:SbcC/MukB-like Walker B domain-containing protein [Cyclobacterium plantarum]|uniref:SMC family ATPase n=1 Tax=Cyclobacterium plantarum TaxID=2716263 RepID=A0ABX0HB01_9BACT|nr:SMC family ATPase [Cyclobacterium plantarum]NHE58540.1 SMC family ATPase [Cyclobacterium plantarum]
MIPIKLTLQGLYSYKEPQTIDFSQLTAAGLFGIFGAVGSGKSSILEAILLALYGSTERLSDRGEKNSMVNLQSDFLLINFEFTAGKNHSYSYLARYAVKRNPKNFDDIRPAEHTFYKRQGEEMVPIAERAETIIGMKKEHFKQTVIIPQGKFREFIDLKPGDRASMMKELFGLERFDLYGKTGTLLKREKEEGIKLQTKLEALEHLSPEMLKDKLNEKSHIGEELKKQRESFDLSSRELQQMEGIKEKHQELKAQTQSWEILEKQIPDIEKKKTELKAFLQARTHLWPVWEKIQEEEMNLEEASVGFTDCSRFKLSYEQEIKNLEREEADLKEKAEKRSEREAKIRDLKKVLEIQAIREDLKAAQDKLNVLKPQLENSLQQEKTLKEQWTESDQEAEKTEKNGGSELLAIYRNDARDWMTFEEQGLEIRQEMKEMELHLQQYATQIETMTKKLPQKYGDFDEWVEAQKADIQTLEAEKERLIEKKALQHHAHVLNEGEPCPLCGSSEHPSPLNPDQSQELLENVKGELSKAATVLDQSQQMARDLMLLRTQKENENQKIQNKTEALKRVKDQLNQVQQKLGEQGIPDLQALQAMQQKLEDEVQKQKDLQIKSRTLRKKLDQLRTQIDSYQEEFQAVQQHVLGLNSTLKAKQEEITNPDFTQAYLQKTREVIRLTIEKVQEDILETANLLDSKQKVLNDTKSKAATNLANLENFKTKKEKATEKLQNLNDTFEMLRQEWGFEDKEKLVQLFSRKVDTDQVDQEIREYEKNCSVVKSRISVLENTPGVKDFDPEKFDEITTRHLAEKEALEKIQNQLTLLNQVIVETRDKLEEKDRLSQSFKKLEIRLSYFRELEQLFKGSGFVKYVSRIYLRELCNTANLRFSKLTKNSLSLEIDDNNTFWVVDYLNGGKKRLLKTLSGGQTFQASLCLALALAEKVKSLNQADQSFFFLDEGFGALDRNSLRVVFETLKALRHENRIVGIISHVEELQQEIEVYANIELDPDRGSQVRYSFS